MDILINPSRSEWQSLVCRPTFDASTLFATVRPMMEAVRLRGDEAVLEYEHCFDCPTLDSLAVTTEEAEAAEALLGEPLKAAINQAAINIRRFHEAQRFSRIRVETAPGVVCEQKAVPIGRVGLYIPGGSAPLFSTVLMLAIPASIAGCEEIVLCSPPDREGHIHPAILFAARLCGIHHIYKTGGAQAIAAMAYGTQTVPRVFKIFGPGNQYVMAAKQLASLSHVAIDMPAGPSEVEVLMDDSAVPAFVAADLLSQAEHGPDSQAMLVCTDQALLPPVMAEVEKQLAALPRAEIARKALAHSKAVVLPSMQDAIDFTNEYAPEHLIIATAHSRETANLIRHAGSVFIGNCSCESAGDYASGTNHTLPTAGYATAYSGLSLDSFVRKMTLQEITPQGVASIGHAVVEMAQAEKLDAHANAMRLRMKETGSPT